MNFFSKAVALASLSFTAKALARADDPAKLSELRSAAKTKASAMLDQAKTERLLEGPSAGGYPYAMSLLIGAASAMSISPCEPARAAAEAGDILSRLDAFPSTGSFTRTLVHNASRMALSAVCVSAATEGRVADAQKTLDIIRATGHIIGKTSDRDDALVIMTDVYSAWKAGRIEEALAEHIWHLGADKVFAKNLLGKSGKSGFQWKPFFSAVNAARPAAEAICACRSTPTKTPELTSVEESDEISSSCAAGSSQSVRRKGL